VTSLAAKLAMQCSRRNIFLELRTKREEVVQERVLRCQAEFSVEQLCLQGQSGKSQPPAHFCDKTSSSGTVFSDIGEPSSPCCEITRLEQIAKQGHWLIDKTEVSAFPSHKLGEGAFGVVVAGSFHGLPVAVKISKTEDPRVQRGLPELLNEIRVLRHVRHPHIVLFYGACVNLAQGRMAVILELIQGVTLQDFVHQCSSGSTSMALATTHSIEAIHQAILRDVGRALCYLHSRQPCIVHGDIKDTNILIQCLSEGRPHVKLLDFGLSRVISRKAKPLGGTLRWMAPELFKSNRESPSAASDVFSYGRLACFVITGVEPLSNFSPSQIKRLMQTRSWKALSTSWPTMPFAQAWKGIAVRCMQMDPLLRPSIHAVQEDASMVPTLVSIEDIPSGMFMANVTKREGEGLESAMRKIDRSVQVAHEKTSRSISPEACSAESPKRPPSVSGLGLSVLSVELPTLPEEDINIGEAGHQRKVPCLKPTSTAIKKLTIAFELKKWYCKMPSTACCSFHVSLNELFELCLQMLKSCKCIRKFRLAGDIMQCSHCLLLSKKSKKHEQNMCTFCNKFSGESTSESIRNDTHKIRSKACSHISSPVGSTCTGKPDAQENSGEPNMPGYSKASSSLSYVGSSPRISFKTADVPVFRHTPDITKKRSISTMLLKWSYVESTLDCCIFHTKLQDLRNLCLEMKCKSRCIISPDMDGDVVQCPKCLSLVDADDHETCICEFCNHRLHYGGDTAASTDAGTSGANGSTLSRSRASAQKYASHGLSL